jgi:DNA polymerase I
MIMFLLGVKYLNNRPTLLLLNEAGRLEYLPDWSGHKPYFLTNETFDTWDARIKGTPSVELYDRMRRKYVKLRKIVVDSPNDVLELRGKVKNAWEADIKYMAVYMHDLGLVPSINYTRVGDRVQPVMADVSDDVLENLLGQPIPDIPFISMDIEVDSPEVRPNPENPIYPINMASLVSKGEHLVLYTHSPMQTGYGPLIIPGATTHYCHDEKELIKHILLKIWEYPIVVTFNGFNFDFYYMLTRGLRIGLTKDEMCLARRGHITDDNGEREFITKGVTTRDQVHIDLYQILSNNTIKNYVYGQKYRYNNLNDISLALLGRGKVEHEKPLNELSARELGVYCLNDAQLTYDLMANKDNELLRVLISLSRLCKITIEELTTYGTSRWDQSLLAWVHKQNGYLIPNRNDLGNSVAQTKPIIEGKKYHGATVFEPKVGLHFGVIVLDFASLYPTIMDCYNVSYETIDCPHEACKSNRVPGTSHWYCGIERGVVSDTISSIRKTRVERIKPQSKSDSLAKCNDQGIKTVMNSSYGVFGSEKFSLYSLPVAETVTAWGRYILSQLKMKCDEMKLSVYGGDTDSVFLQVTPEDATILIDWAKATLKVDLEVDKEYAWLGLSRKKNYLGLTTKGDMVIKGLTGKKSLTPKFAADVFNRVVEILKPMTKDSGVPVAALRGVIDKGLWDMLDRCYPIQEYEVKMEVKHREYKEESVDKRTGKTRKLKKPQHIRAMAGEALEVGQVVKFIKTVVGPVRTHKYNNEELDYAAYLKIYRTALEQVLDALGLSFVDMVNVPVIEEYTP